ncbi:MAG: hypothetical protein ACPGVU_21690 [Limisphaerales bacterium]
MAAKAAAMNDERLRLSYPRWFQALYQDKYDYLGEYDLMRIAVRLDVGLYYMCVAIQPFLRGLAAFKEPHFSPLPSIPFFWWMRGYNRRLASIARARRKTGRLGLRNNDRRQLLKGFAFDSATAFMIARAMIEWIWLELKELFARVVAILVGASPADSQPKVCESGRRDVNRN